MDAQTLHINLIVPQGWQELTDEQLRYLYNLIAHELSSEENIKTTLAATSDGLQPMLLVE